MDSLYIFIFRIGPYYQDKFAGCDLAHDVYLENFRGIVVKKFVDASEHNNETIIYRDENKTEVYLILYSTDYGDLYENLNVGDSIIKKKNAMNYRVKFKATGKDSIFKFETSCKDSLAKSSSSAR